MKFLEKDLEEIIYNEAIKDGGRESLYERGLYTLRENDVIFRQTKIGAYGVSDLLFVEYKKQYIEGDVILLFDIEVLELKKDTININSLIQAIGYAAGIRSYLRGRGHFCKINITLIGKTIENQTSFCYTPDIFNNVSFYTYKYDFDGISFKKEYGYKLTNEGF